MTFSPFVHIKEGGRVFTMAKHWTNILRSVFGEPLISCSWALLKLEPQIGLHGPLIAAFRTQGGQEGAGFRGSWGHTEQRWLPAAGSSDAKKKQARSGERGLAHWNCHTTCSRVLTC